MRKVLVQAAARRLREGERAVGVFDLHQAVRPKRQGLSWDPSSVFQHRHRQSAAVEQFLKVGVFAEPVKGQVRQAEQGQPAFTEPIPRRRIPDHRG